MWWLLLVMATPPAPRPNLAHDWVQADRGEVDALRLTPTAGGGYRYEAPEHGFAAVIRVDGSVVFEPIRRNGWQLTLRPLEAWVDGFVDALLRPAGHRDRPELEYPMPPRDDIVSRAAALAELAPPGAKAAIFGPTVRVDPGRVAKKAKRDFMKRTEALRDAMTIRFRERQREEAVAAVSKQVVEIWKNDALPLRLRKQQIFELWDDWEGSNAARARIEKAVRLLAPKGSPSAFSPRRAGPPQPDPR